MATLNTLSRVQDNADCHDLRTPLCEMLPLFEVLESA
jgi:hypothetical protein